MFTRRATGYPLGDVSTGAWRRLPRCRPANCERNVPTRDRVIITNPYLAALLAVGGVTGLALPFRAYLGPVDVLVFYLVAVTGVSLLANIRASLVAAIAAFLAFNFFFTTPHYTFFVANTHDILALLALLGLSFLISQLVVRLRSRALEAIRHAQQTETLYRLSFALIRASGLEEVLASIVEGVRGVFELSVCAILLKDGEGLRVGASSDERLRLAENRELLDLAADALQRASPAGGDTLRLAGHSLASTTRSHALGAHEILLVPILTADERIGVLLAARERELAPFDEDDSRLLATFANQAALAIERSLLAEERTRAVILSRTDELRKALLSAVSHDLRTPLTSIKASITTLMQTGIDWRDADRRELMTAIDEETDRLNRIVANLLDLSRIEAGALQPARDWYAPEEIVRDALDRYSRLLEGREVTVEFPCQAVLVDVDFVMISEVLANLLENAVKYSPAGTPVRIAARLDGAMLDVSITDRGVGIPPGEEERIFDKFYRVESRWRASGSGMGLAICRGFVEAHGGRIWATRNDGNGSTFTFSLPLAGDGTAVPAQPALADARHSPAP